MRNVIWLFALLCTLGCGNKRVVYYVGGEKHKCPQALYVQEQCPGQTKGQERQVREEPSEEQVYQTLNRGRLHTAELNRSRLEVNRAEFEAAEVRMQLEILQRELAESNAQVASLERQLNQTSVDKDAIRARLIAAQARQAEASRKLGMYMDSHPPQPPAPAEEK